MSIVAAARDRSIDGLRALAVIGVVSGHWLVTAFVVDDYGIAVVSPLRQAPALAPLTWVLQALAPFFCAAGFAAARGLAGGRSWGAWLGPRVMALVPPVGRLIGFWVVLLAVLLVDGYPLATLLAIGKLVVSPLWFLGVLIALWVAWPLLDRLDHRFRGWALLPPAMIVTLDDLVRYAGVPVPSPVVWLLGVGAVVCAWSIPFLFGVRLARGGGPGRADGSVILTAGVLGLAALVLMAGYPASAVGVTGAARSNLVPPSLLVLALTAVQLGLFVLVRSRLRPVRRPGRATARLTAMALPVFLWQQTALLLLVLGASRFAPVVGLTARPDGATWVLARLAWFPVLTAVLAVLGLLVGAARDQRSGRQSSHS